MYSEAPDTYGGAPSRPLPLWRDPGSGHRGLGLVATLAPLGISAGTSLFSSMFADTPDHDAAQLDQWARAAATGSGLCASGRTAGGELVRIDPLEAIEAVKWAPEGRPGDPPGTYQGLVTAVYLPTSSDGPGKATDFRPYMTTREATARLAVGVAHGRIDCGVGWQEEPAAEHLRELIRLYKARPPGPVAAVTGAVQQGVAQVKPLAAGFLADEDNKAAALFLGMIALGAVGAMVRGKL